MAVPPVVLGAGLAGLAATAALRRTYPEVIVLERDQLPAGPEPRRGVPQGGQLHNLLTRAQRHLDDLLPGFTDRLLAAGGRAATVGTETHVHELGIAMPARDLGLRLLCAPRPLVDHVARSMLGELGGVSFRTGHRATDLVVAEDRIAGVVTDGCDGPRVLDASVVIDASGPGTQVPRWLAAAGAQAPEQVQVQPRQWYITVVLRRPAASVGDPRFWLAFPWGDEQRGALLSPVGDDRWYLSVSGRDGDPIPQTFAEVVAHARALPDPAIGRLVAEARPEGDPSTFRKLTATWHRYDRLAAPLGGLFPVGDALACLNPLFGQGMSVAAWEASCLADVLAEAGATGADPGSPETARAHHRAAAGAVGAAWDLGLAIDEASAHLDGPGALARLVATDPDVHRRYVGVWHLIEPVSWLRQLPSDPRPREASTS